MRIPSSTSPTSAAALLVSSPALFADYIGWAGTVMSAAGIRPEDVRENLVCLGDVCGEQLATGMAAVVAIYVESALERLAEPQPDVPATCRTQSRTPGSPGRISVC